MTDRLLNILNSVEDDIVQNRTVAARLGLQKLRERLVVLQPVIDDAIPSRYRDFTEILALQKQNLELATDNAVLRGDDTAAIHLEDSLKEMDPLFSAAIARLEPDTGATR